MMLQLRPVHWRWPGFAAPHRAYRRDHWQSHSPRHHFNVRTLQQRNNQNGMKTL